MRSSDSYRGHKRNALREQGILRGWRFARPWMKANTEAKILDRQKVCAAARAAVFEALASGRLDGMEKRAIPIVLSGFWNKQPNSRVRSRILRESAAC